MIQLKLKRFFVLGAVLIPASALADNSVCAQKHGAQVCISAGSSVFIKKDAHTFKSCLVQSVAADGSMSCYTDGSYQAMNFNTTDIVTSVSSFNGIQQGSNIILRDDVKTYRTYTVETIYSDGSFELYGNGGYSTLSNDDVMKRVVTSLTSLAGIQQGTNIVLRDSDKHYITYTVETIYSDGSFELYGNGGYSILSKDELLAKYVTTSTQMQLTIQTYQGSQQTTFQQGTNIILRDSDKHYITYTVETIYSDQVVELYGNGGYSYVNKSELSQELVLSLPNAGPFQQGTNAIIRDSDKHYNTYTVEAIYSDGVLELYGGGGYSYRTLSDLTKEDVTSVNQLSVSIKTVNGDKTSAVNQGTNIILKQGDGKYSTYTVEMIYSDQEIQLYGSGSYSYANKSDLGSQLVESWPSLGAFNQGMSFALLKSGAGPLDRDDYAVESIYSDGILELYSQSGGYSYKLASEMPVSSMIKLADSIGSFHKQGIYVVKDKSGKQLIVMPTQLYSDQVMRYVLIDSDQIDSSKTKLAKASDFTYVNTACDPSQNFCESWWQQNASTTGDLPLLDSLSLEDLSARGAALKINQVIGTQWTFGNPDDDGSASCTLKLSGANSSSPGDVYVVNGISVNSSSSGALFWSSQKTEAHLIATSNGHELDLDCKFPSDKASLGDLRKVLGGTISVVPKGGK